MSRFFGAVTQNGYVVRDIQAAMRHWIEVLDVGPWYYIDRAPIVDFTYKGTPSPAEVSIALANSGTLQIELIQQRNDGPSMYHDFLQAGHEGLQHVAYWTTTFEADLARALDAGYVIGQSGRVGDPGRFIYFQTEGASWHGGRALGHQRPQGADVSAHRRSRARLGRFRPHPHGLADGRLKRGERRTCHG